MKIIHIIYSLGCGGAERFVIDLCNELSKSNEVYIVSVKSVTSDMVFVRDLNKRVRLIEMNKKAGVSFIFYIKLLRIINKIKPDTINSHLGTINYLFLAMMFFRRIKFYHTIHSMPKEEEPRLLFRIIRKIFLKRKLGYAISISNKTNESFNELYGVKSALIYNGVTQKQKSQQVKVVQQEINRLNNKQGKVFLAVGRLAYEKNFALLAKTFKKLNEDNKNVLLLIIGKDVTLDLYYKKEILNINAQNVYLLDFKTNIIDYMSCADALCFSSLYEGMPITALEAFSVGLPVISTPVGGLVDLVKNNLTGFVSDDISVKGLYDAIVRFLETPQDVINKIKLNCVSKYEKFYSIEICAKNYIELYNAHKAIE